MKRKNSHGAISWKPIGAIFSSGLILIAIGLTSMMLSQTVINQTQAGQLSTFFVLLGYALLVFAIWYTVSSVVAKRK